MTELTGFCCRQLLAAGLWVLLRPSPRILCHSHLRSVVSHRRLCSSLMTWWHRLLITLIMKYERHVAYWLVSDRRAVVDLVLAASWRVAGQPAAVTWPDHPPNHPTHPTPSFALSLLTLAAITQSVRVVTRRRLASRSASRLYWRWRPFCPAPTPRYPRSRISRASTSSSSPASSWSLRRCSSTPASVFSDSSNRRWWRLVASSSSRGTSLIGLCASPGTICSTRRPAHNGILPREACSLLTTHAPTTDRHFPKAPCHRYLWVHYL